MRRGDGDNGVVLEELGGVFSFVKVEFNEGLGAEAGRLD